MTDATTPTPGDRLRAALSAQGWVDPDRAASAQNRARQLGAPRGALTSVPPEQWPAPRQNFDVDDFLRRAPRTSNYLSNVDNAQIAGDPESRDNLASLEDKLRAPVDPIFRSADRNSRYSTDTLTPLRRANTPGNWLRGLSAAITSGEAWSGSQLALGDALGLWRNPAERETVQRSFNQGTAAVEMARPDIQGNFASGVYGGVESIARQAPGLALSVLLRNPAPSLAVAGAQTGGQSYGKYSARGATGAEAAAGAAGEAGVEVLTELIPMGRLIGALGAPAAKKFIVDLGVSALADIPGEQIATLAQDAIDTAIANPDKTWGDYLKERPDAAVQTLVASVTQSVLLGGTAAGLRATGAFVDKQEQVAARAEMDASTIGNIVENATNSPLRTRSPETFQEFMAQAAEGGPVTDLYISAEALNQSGVDIAALRAAVPSVDQQIEQAAADGGDVRIPVEEFAARGVEVEGADALVDHMRINPALPSRAEVSALADNQAAELQAQAQQVLADATTDDAFRQSAERVETGFYDQLQAAGRFTKDVNRSYASLVGNFYAVQAKRLGITPEQMAERYPLKITADLPQANRPTTLDQEETVDLVHYSTMPRLEMSDPTRWGTSRSTQDSERARKQAGAPGRTYFGVAGVYQGEPAVGIRSRPLVYRASIPASKLYDFDNDPLGLRDGPAGALNGPQATAYEQAIQAAGFSGYRSDAVIRGAVAVFDPLPLTVADREFAQGPDRLAPVEGAPKSVKVNGETQKIAPFAPAREAAYDYMASRGLRYEPPTTYAKVDVQRATRVADAFDLMDHNPDDPLVRAAYSAMIEETLAQYQFVKATGLEVEFITGDDPYAASPRLAIQDVVENNHLWVFPTDDGFGGTASADVDVSGNPLLAMVDEWVGDRQLRANDVFRIVHDYFGHIKDGYGFRADGEENAWQSHAAMFSPLARRAMTTETRGQNSWVNYGPFGEFNKTASGADTQYAPQKIGLLPSWAETEGFLGGAESGTPLNQTLFQSEREEVRPHPAFYSALLRAVAKAPQAKASAAQWKATLAKTPGVKKDEIEWSGLNEWLDLLASDNVPPIYQSYVDSKGNVARESIVTFLENGGVRVEEVLLSSGAQGLAIEEDDNGEFYTLQTHEGREVSRHASWEEASDAMDEIGATQFGNYKLPGADDTYRELLLTLPRIDGPSTHWDEPNVVAHTRFTTRTDASGARVLFLEEMQSDWHQKGRDEGYANPSSPEAVRAAEDAYADADQALRDSWPKIVEAARATLATQGSAVDLNDLEERNTRNPASAAVYAYNILNSTSLAVGLGAEAASVLEEYSGARLRANELRQAMEIARGDTGIPDAPFRTSWAQLVMKRMIAYAVENGFDKIAWINGNQQNGGQTGGDGSFFYERNLVNSTNDLLKKLGGRVEPVDMRSASAFASRDAGEQTRRELLAEEQGIGDTFAIQQAQDRLDRYVAARDAATTRPTDALGIQNGFVITDQMKAQAADGFALFQQNRGQIALGQDITQTPSVISLLRTADLSTFLHETGHFFLEVTRDMASREDAPPEIKQDFGTLLSWFGVSDAAAWQAMPFEDKRKYHEQFARGFEAFLFEGRAPTPALRELFQRFRSWLLNVYRSLTALNVELTPDVRQVMGRMVASQDEIVEANAEYGFTPLAEKPPYMDAASWADYQGAFFAATEEGVDTLSTRAVRDMKWLSNARSKALRRLQNEARLQRRAVKAEVTEEVQAEPVNRARAYLRRGIGPDGEPVPGALKLDRAALEAAYGTEPNAIWRSLRTGGKYGEVQTDGIDPDVAAEMFGYESGDALVRDLVAAEPPQEKIAGLTDQRMLERYGDMADAAGVERAADEAVANDAHIRAIATDYAALATATGQPRALAAATREHAARIVNSIPLKRLKPAQFFAAMTRAGKAADKAAKAGDLVLAATNRRNQLINLQAAKYALEARAEVDKGLTRFQRIVSANDEALTRSRDMALVNAARAILNLYGFGRVKNDPAAYLDLVKSYDPQLYADIQPFVEGARGGAKPLDLITYEQFQGLRDTVNQLWALSLRTRQIELDGRLVDIKVAQAALSARLDEIGVNVPVGQDQAPTEGQKFSRGLQGARAALRRVESWARGVDAADSGPFRSFIWNPVSTAADRYRIAQADYIRQFLALVEPIRGTLKNKKIAAPEIGYTFTGKAELLHAVLHSGNTSNLSKLLLGRRWGKQTEDGALDTTRWDAFLERAWAEGVLTKEDYDFAQGVWDLLESTKPAAQAAHRAMYGRYFSEVTAQPVQTPWGVYAGGYVPATTDSFMVQDAALRQEQEALEDSNAFMFPAASNGFTKSRVEDYTRELSLDIRLLPMHLDKVLKFTHLGPPVRDVARLLKGKEFSAKLNAFDPVAATDLLLPWLQRSARQVVSEPTKGWGGKHVDAFFRGARARAGMQIMFGNFSNVLQQFTSFSNAATRVRPAKIAKGLWAYARDPKGTSEAVTGLSDFMKTRANAQVFEMRQSIEQILLDANGLDKLKDFAARHAYFLQQALQNVTDAAVWKGAFDQAVERGDDDLEAIRFADSVIRETQGSLSPEDVSRFETGTPFIRFFTQFYSYFNNQANMLGTEGLVVARTGGVKNGMGRLLYVYMMGYAVPALLGQAIADLMRGGWDDDEDDGYLDEFLNWFFMSQVKFGLAAVPIVGPAANAAIGGFTPASYDDRVSVSPAISMFDASLALPGTYYEAIVEGEGLKGRDVRDTMNMLGLISGLPVGALGRPVAYGYGVATDQIEPTSAADAARGVVTGTASPGSRVQ